MAKKKVEIDPYEGMERNADGFVILRDKPGLKVQNGKIRTKLPKDPNVFADEEDRIEKDVGIGDYVLKKGIIHALNMNVGRHIPSIEDGLKPVERRMLYCMYNLKLYPTASRMKVATIGGDIVGKVHPHGEQSGIDTLYRVARSFSMMIPYVDCHGNCGNMNTMKPGAPRYVEARLSKYAMDCFFSEMDLDIPIYDERETFNYETMEPVFLPSKYPNILLQYNMGIGKGASTNIVAFNSEDVFKAAIKLLDNPDAKVDIYPDTPVDVDIINKSELKGCFDKAQFKVKIRGRYKTYIDRGFKDQRHIVDKYCIEFTSCPMNTYGELIKEEIIKLKLEDEKKSTKQFQEILDVECAGDTKELRLVITYEKGYDPHDLAEKLFKSTSLQTTYGADFTLIENNKPERYTPRELMIKWIEQRMDQMRRYFYQKAIMAAKEKSKCDAYCIAIDPKNVDAIVKLIKTSKHDEESIAKLTKQFGFSRFQAKHVIRLQLRNISKLNADELRERAKEAEANYRYCRKMLSGSDMIKNHIRNELEEGLAKYSRPRRAKLMNIVAGSGDVDQTKYIFYDKNIYFCVKTLDEVSKIADKMRGDFKMLEIQNGDTLLLFNRSGMMKKLSGFAFKETMDGVGLDQKAFGDVVQIINAKDPYKMLTFVSENGYGKQIAKKDLEKLDKGRIMNLSDEVGLAAVIPTNREGGMLFLFAKTHVYYCDMNAVPELKRIASGNRLMKPTEPLTGGCYVPDNAKQVILMGEYGYGKIMDMEFLGIKKRGNNIIDTKPYQIHHGMPLAQKCMYLGDKALKPIVFVDEGKKISIVLGDNKPNKIAKSTTIGNCARLVKLGKHQFYQICPIIKKQK